MREFRTDQRKKAITGSKNGEGMKKRKELFFTLLPWICLIGAYLAAVLFHLIYGKQLINSDMSAEIVLADLMNENGDFLVSRGWYYSTELWVINRHITLRLGLLLFPHNWHYARTFSQALMLAAHAGAYLFLVHECELKQIGIYSAAILMCPFGYWYMWYGTYNCSYLIFMIFISLNLAISLHIMKGKKHSIICMILLLLLSFGEGLNGVRLLMNYYIPLCAAAVVLIFLYLQEGKPQVPLKAIAQMRLGGIALASTVFCGVGYLINIGILSGIYSFTSYSGQYWRELDLDELIGVFGMFLSLFGYPYQENVSDLSWRENYLFSVNGILGALGLVMVLTLIFSMIRLLKRWKELTVAQRLVIFLLCACLLLDGIVYAWLTLENNPINASYWLPLVPLAVAVIAIEIKTEYFSMPALQGAVTAALLFCVACCSVSTVSRFLQYPPRAKEGLEAVGEWLVENGWTQGYATFWNGNVLTELTDGEVEVWVVSGLDNLNIDHWLQSKSHDTAPDGKVFVLLKSDDNYPYYFEENLLYADENGWVVMGYDSAGQLYELMEQAAAGS